MLGEIINALDNNEKMKEFIDSMVQVEYDNEQTDFTEAIKQFFDGYKAVEALSSEDFNVLLDVINNNINDKVAEKSRIHAESDAKAYEQDYIDQYGDHNSAYYHIFEMELGISPEYNKALLTSFTEIRGNQK